MRAGASAPRCDSPNCKSTFQLCLFRAITQGSSHPFYRGIGPGTPNSSPPISTRLNNSQLSCAFRYQEKDTAKSLTRGNGNPGLFDEGKNVDLSTHHDRPTRQSDIKNDTPVASRKGVGDVPDTVIPTTAASSHSTLP